MNQDMINFFTYQAQKSSKKIVNQGYSKLLIMIYSILIADWAILSWHLVGHLSGEITLAISIRYQRFYITFLHYSLDHAVENKIVILDATSISKYHKLNLKIR